MRRPILLDADDVPVLERDCARAGPDSRTLAFFTSDGTLVRTDLEGRDVRTICEAPSGRGGTWRENGTIVFAPTAGSPLFAVPATGGEPFQVTRIDRGRAHTEHRYPQFLPDGRHVLFTALPPADGQFESLVAELPGSAHDDPSILPSGRRIEAASSTPLYVDPGFLLLDRGGPVVARRFDLTTLEPVGPELPTGLTTDAPVGYAGSAAIAESASDVLVTLRAAEGCNSIHRRSGARRPSEGGGTSRRRS